MATIVYSVLPKWSVWIKDQAAHLVHPDLDLIATKATIVVKGALRARSKNFI